MGILVGHDTRVIFQGLTGATATRMAERAIASGTRVVGGVTPGKGGARHLSLPVFDSVAEAVAETRGFIGAAAQGELTSDPGSR